MNIVERMNAYSELTKIPKTAIVELALTEYLDKVAPETKNKNDKETPKE